MSHRKRASDVGKRLGRRPLVYFGPRGTDAESLQILPNFERVICMIAPGAEVETHCLEKLSGVRRELNGYSFDDDFSQAARTLQETLRTLEAGCVLLPYVASRIGSEVWITRRGGLEYLGPFDEAQTALAHKPWVESSLAVAGVRVVPWIYSPQPQPSSIPREWRGYPLVVRRSAKSQGGICLTLLRSVDELDELPPMAEVGSYYSISRLIEPAVPLNVNACVFPDGRITLHGCSVQLIGLAHCTVRPFGFCGNDFGAAQELPSSAIHGLGTMARSVGRWLASQGYRGAFGIDALVDEQDVYLVEVNARFQASSPLAATIDRDNDRPDQYLNHIASFVGLEPPDSASLFDLIRQQPARSQIFMSNTDRDAVTPESTLASQGPGYEIDLVAETGIVVEPEALLARVSTDGSVTRTGRCLVEPAADLVTTVLEALRQGERGIDH